MIECDNFQRPKKAVESSKLEFITRAIFVCVLAICCTYDTWARKQKGRQHYCKLPQAYQWLGLDYSKIRF